MNFKDMIEYGYKYIGVIPFSDYEEAYHTYNDGKSVLILYQDNTETYVESSAEFFRLKNEVMYGIERDTTEIKLINRAIEELRKPGDASDDLFYNLRKSGKNEAWKEVLHILGFSDEDIKIAIKEADLGFGILGI